MSNIFEALEQAQRENYRSNASFSSPNQEPEVNRDSVSKNKKIVETKPTASPSSLDLEAELLCLYQNIDCLMPNNRDKSILFVAPQGGEGVSTIVREFAQMAVRRLDKRVVIMDTAHHKPSQHLYYNISSEYGWKDAMEKGESAAGACHPAGNPNLFLSPTRQQSTLPPQLHNHTAASGFMGELKSRFNLLLIDASPVSVSPDSVILSRYTDSVVLVIEAERTRWQVVESLRNKIERNGGNVRGVVFNKRKYHIPKAIYRLLG